MKRSTAIVASLATLAILGAAVWWLTWASPQAQFYRAESAKRDTVAAFEALKDSAERAASPVWAAGNRHFDRYRAMPWTRAQFIAAGMDSTRLTDNTDADTRSLGFRILRFRTPVLPPALFQSPQVSADSLEVSIFTQRDESYRVSVSLYLDGRYYSCRDGPLGIVGLVCGWQ